MSGLGRALPTVPFQVPVRGVKAGNVDLAGVVRGLMVELVKEPDNPVDPDAVVVRAMGRDIGYLPKDVAARMGDPVFFSAWVDEVYEHKGKPAGVRLMVKDARGFKLDE